MAVIFYKRVRAGKMKLEAVPGQAGAQTDAGKGGRIVCLHRNRIVI